MKSPALQTRFLFDDYDRLLNGLDDRHVALEPFPGAKTAGWLVGHLVVTGDFARRLVELAPMAPKEWRPLFSPGTHPSPDAATYPPMASLVETLRAIYSGLAAAAPAATAASLDAPNPYAPARAALPTARDFATYLMTGHLGYHLGQLAAWRAAAMPTPRNKEAA